MNTKLVKELKGNWAKVSEQGGHFLFLFGRWPEEGEPGPILAVHPKREPEVADVRKLDRTADAAGKRTWGRVVVEEDKSLTFYVSTDAHTKAPAVLREALKALPDRPELKGVRLDGLRRCACRMDETVDTTGQAPDLAGLEALAKPKGLFGRLVKSDSAKLLGRLAAWNAKYGTSLAASNVRAAQVELDELRERCRAWAESRPDAAGKRQADRLKVEIAKAKTFLDAFQKSVREDAAADVLADRVLAGEDLGPDLASAPLLQNAAEKLAGRLALGEEGEERDFVARKLQAVADRCGEGIVRVDGQLTTLRLNDPPDEAAIEKQLAARRQLRVAVANGVASRLQLGAGPVEDGLLRSLDFVTEGLCEDLRTASKSDHVGPIGRVYLDLARLLDERGGDATPHVEALANVGVALTTANYVAARGVLGNLGRSNTVDSAIRTLIARHHGEDFTDRLLDDTKRVLALHPTIGPRTITEETDPGTPERFEQADRIGKAILATLLEARRQLVDAVLGRLGLPATLRDAVVAVVENPGEVRLGRATGVGTPIDTLALAREAVHKNEAIRTAVVAQLLERANTFHATRIALDPDPGTTDRLLRAHLLAKVTAGAIDLDEALIGFDPPHWERPPLAPHVLAGMLEDLDLLREVSEEQERLETEAQQRVQGRYDAANDVQTRQLLPLMNETLQGSQSLQLLLEAFTDLMENFLADVDAIPEGIVRYAARVVAAAREAGLGDEGDRLVLADLLMLRWISPTIVTTGGNQPTGVTLSALVQFVANHQTPNDHRLLGFVPTIEAYTVRFDRFVQDFLRRLDEPQDD